MADDEKKVNIIGWPDDPAKHEHKFMMEEPCPVSIFFTKPPANVVIHTSPENPIHVEMDMNVKAEDTFPVCIKLCEPICADSDYTIGLQLFDRRLGAITVQGRTKFFNCREGEKPELTCFDFKELKPKIIFEDTFEYHEVKFTPLGDRIVTSLIGEPSGQVKLQFPREGVRIDFPHPVTDVTLTVNNYAGDTIKFEVFDDSNLVNSFTETIYNEVKTIAVSEPSITAIEVSGGDNEASIVEVCYFPS